MKLTNPKVFTDREAWNLFRLAAFGEAIGWTLLISGILLSRYVVHGNNDPTAVAGQLHGTLFIAYLAACLAVSGSLRWSARTTIIAVAVSVPPYGTLIFEQWLARARKIAAHKTDQQIVVRAIISYKQQLLAIQPVENISWQLPGGAIQDLESPQEALIRNVYEQTSVRPKIGTLSFIYSATEHGKTHLELFFTVTNGRAFAGELVSSLPQAKAAIDEFSFVSLDNDDLVPAFLKRHRLKNSAPVYISDADPST